MTFPRGVRFLAVLAVALLVLPIVGLISRVDGARVVAELGSPAALSALALSLTTAAVATAICTILGVPLALVLARASRGWTSVLRMLVLVPLVLSPMVGGLALLALLGRSGLLGRPLFQLTGISLPYSTAAVVIAQAFVALPFLVITLEGALRTSGTGHEQVAASLGARPWQVFARVTVPLLAPGLVSAVALCFARAVGEFGATALFAGNLEGVTRTMPLAIYTAFNGVGVSQGSAVALSLLLLLSAAAIVLGIRSWREEAVR